MTWCIMKRSQSSCDGAGSPLSSPPPLNPLAMQQAWQPRWWWCSWGYVYILWWYMIHDAWYMIHDTYEDVQIYIMVKWMYVCLCVAKNDHFHEFYQDEVWYVFHLNVSNTNLTNKRCIECLFLAIWVQVHRSPKISTFSRKLFGASCESPKKQRNTKTISKKFFFQHLLRNYILWTI